MSTSLFTDSKMIAAQYLLLHDMIIGGEGIMGKPKEKTTPTVNKELHHPNLSVQEFSIEFFVMCLSRLSLRKPPDPKNQPFVLISVLSHVFSKTFQIRLSKTILGSLL